LPQSFFNRISQFASRPTVIYDSAEIAVRPRILVNNPDQPNNPLHGVTLAMMLEQLVEHYGWDELGLLINIRCFLFDPTVKSSLQFLRRTPWARAKVESLYLKMLQSRQ